MKKASITPETSDLETAVALLREAIETLAEGSPDYIDAQYRLGNALSRYYEQTQNSHDLEQAIQAYTIAVDTISPEHYDRKQIWQAIPATQSILGSRLVRSGEWQEGLQLLRHSIEQLRNSDDKLAYANALYQTGRAHEILTDWYNARTKYRDALRIYKHFKEEPGIAKSRLGLGSVLIQQGYLDKGLHELEQAQELYTQLGQPKKIAEVERLLQAAQRAQQRTQALSQVNP
jgi:tetratricopeptide (TPR) repeat protein